MNPHCPYEFPIPLDVGFRDYPGSCHTVGRYYQNSHGRWMFIARNMEQDRWILSAYPYETHLLIQHRRELPSSSLPPPETGTDPRDSLWVAHSVATNRKPRFLACGPTQQTAADRAGRVLWPRSFTSVTSQR